MDAAATTTAAPMFLFFSISIVCSSAAMLPSQLTPLKHRRGLSTMPAQFSIPTDTTGPGTIPIPPATPATLFPPTAPVTNPVTTPTTNTPGGAAGPPVTNPGMPPGPTAGLPTMPPGPTASLPTMPPTSTGGVPNTSGGMAPSMGGTNAPAAPGQSWCVAKNGAPETSIQVALDYACGIGGVDCSAIQQGATCYNPNTLQNHASYAFNSYYQKNPGPTSCDFGGVAQISNTNPSTGSCVFPMSSSSNPTPTLPTPSSTQPATTSPTGMMTQPPTDPTTTSPMGMIPPPTPPTSTGATPTSGAGISPNILNASSPNMGGAPLGFGAGPPLANTTSDSMSAGFRNFPGCIIAVILIMMGRMIMSI